MQHVLLPYSLAPLPPGYRDIAELATLGTRVIAQFVPGL